MADYLVDTDFKGRDMVSPALRGMGREVTRFSKESNRSLSGIMKGTFLGTLGAHAVTGGLMLARRGIGELTSEYLNFDQQINAAAVKFGNIDYGTDKFKELGEVAREVGRTTKFTTGDASEGLMAMAGAGFEVGDAMKMLAPMANFAAAAKMDLATATTVAGQALNAFAMNSKDAVIQGTNLVKISDLLAATDSRTMATMEGLGETVSWAAGVFTAAGQSIETFGAISGGLADVAVEGSSAGTVMRSMVKNLTEIGPKGKKALSKLGMGMKDIRNEKGEFENMITILEKMEAPLKKLGSHARSKTVGEIFGARAVRGVLPLLNKGIDSIKELETGLKSAGGASKRMGDQLNESLTFRVMALQNALLEKGFQVFEKFLGDGKGGIDNIIKAINEFDVGPIVSGFKTIGNVTSFLTKNIDVIVRAGLVFGTIKAATSAKRAMLWGLEIKNALTAANAMGVVGSIGTVGQLGAKTLAGRTGPTLAPSKVRPIPLTRLTVSNADNILMGGAIAGTIGYQIGDALDEYLLEPMRKFSRDLDFRTSNLLSKRDRLKSGTMREDELRAVRSKSKNQMDTSASALISTDTIIGMFHSMFDSDVENPLVKHMREQLERGQLFTESGKQLDTMYQADKDAAAIQDEYTQPFRDQEFNEDISRQRQDEYIQSIADYAQKKDELRIYAENLDATNSELRKMLQGGGGTANIKITLDGPGSEGAKVENMSVGSNAPRVDVSQAGAN